MHQKPKTVPADHRVKNQRKLKERESLRPCQRTKKDVEHENNGDNNCNLHAWNGPKRLGKGAGRVEHWRTNRDHPDYSIVTINQN